VARLVRLMRAGLATIRRELKASMHTMGRVRITWQACGRSKVDRAQTAPLRRRCRGRERSIRSFTRLGPLFKRLQG
jgi:hypothetical protein